MNVKAQIKSYAPEHLDAIIRLSLRAWAPVFDSIQKTLDSGLYHVFYPDGWQASQQKAVEDVCGDKDTHVWVAVNDSDSAVGFVAVKLNREDGMGEIYMVAVDPDAQGRGIGKALTEFALNRMKEAGMTIAMVETGADPGHAAARHTYEKAGFSLWPAARYFKKL